ncbi:MAG: biotin--[acetyl-CoA-carboxylase] ligase [Sediminibacterium sp.]|nr:biotin--[acetyl-CoA-carboxylase] ligase [Sediminibacterium sp.]
MSPATPIITLGEPLIELSEIDSTNMYAMEQIHAQKALSGSVYQTDFQTNGKGQHGRIWESHRGENLLCTYILELNALKKGKNWVPTEQLGLSAAVAMGAQAFFMEFAGEETKIKKPNDIYWRDRKAGGILIENIVRGTDWNWTVIGIGLNINQTHFSNEAGKPVSLKQITGKDWDIKAMQKKLAEALSASLNLWISEGEALTLQKMELQLIKIKSE